MFSIEGTGVGVIDGVIEDEDIFGGADRVVDRDIDGDIDGDMNEAVVIVVVVGEGACV